MGDPYASVKQEIEFLQYSNVKEFAKWAQDKWKPFTRESRGSGGGYPGKCFYNAFNAVKQDPTLTMWVGYGIDANMPIPLKHAWVVDADDVVHDCTPAWNDKEKVYYYGVPVPQTLSDMIFDYEDQHGVTPSQSNDFFMDMEWALTERRNQIKRSMATAESFADLAL